MKKILALVSLFVLYISVAVAQEIPNHSVPVGRGPGVIGYGSVGPCTAGQTLIFQGPSADPLCGAGGGGGGGAVSSVSNADGTLTVSPVTGAVVASANYTSLAFTAPTHQFLNRFSNGFFAAQPAAADISGLGTIATQNASAIAITGGTITGLPMPTSGTDAATKSYVDANISGFKIHQPVTLATTTALPAYTWSATGGGTLTATANAILSIDGTVVTAAARVLVKNELSSGTACNGNINSACDGVYIVNQVGTAGTPYILQRSSANNSAGLAENVAAGWAGSDSVSVSGGSTNGGSVWVNTTAVVTLNLTPLSFVQFTAATGGGVTSVSNADGTLVISPNTGVVIASLNLAKPNFISNSMLVNASVTVNGTLCTLGSSCTPGSAGSMLADTVKCNNTSSTGPALDCLFIVLKNTTGFWVNDSPAAPINFIGSRLMVGDAALNPGNVTLHPCVTSTGDWFTNFEATTSNGPCAYFPFFQMAVETQSNNGVASGAILAAAQTGACTGNCGAYGLASFALSNNGSHTTNIWAFYLECIQTQSSATTACANMESNSVNLFTSPPVPLPSGGPNNANISIACGGAYAGAFNCENAIFIVNNTQAFVTGLLFRAGSIQSGAGPNLDGQPATLAIDMPSLYNISWYNGSTLMTSLWGGTAGKLNIFTNNAGVNIDGNGTATCGPAPPSAIFRVVSGFVVHC